MLFNRWPQFNLRSITQQVADNRAFLQRFLYFKKCFTRNESVTNGFIPGFGIFMLTNDYIDPVIFLVQRLTGTLHPISDNRYYFILYHLLGFRKRKFFT